MGNTDYLLMGYSLKGMFNENEPKVCKMMGKIINWKEYSEICTCGLCLEDIYAITLNKLPPQYRHSLSIKLQGQMVQDEDIEAAIIDAIEKTRKNPRHQ